MKKESTLFEELLFGITFYTASNLRTYLNNFSKLKKGRNSMGVIIYGQYDLLLDINTRFDLYRTEENLIEIKYLKFLSSKSVLNLEHETGIIMPEYTLLNPFSNRLFMIKLETTKIITIKTVATKDSTNVADFIFFNTSI